MQSSANNKRFSDFKAVAERHADTLEEMRRSALASYRARLQLSAMLILAAIAAVYVVFRLGGENEFFWCAVVSAIVLTFTLAFHVVGAIFDYRRKTWAQGAPHSLKETAFHDLFAFFGDYSFKNLVDVEDMQTKGVPASRLRNSPHLPKYHIYRAEDYVSGVYNDAKVEFSEAEMILQEHGKQISLFRGLLVVVDIDELDIKLRGKFSGKGVVIADAKKHDIAVSAQYADYEPVPLPEEHEARFEAYATDVETASRLFTPEMLAHLAALQEIIAGNEEQITHQDEQYQWLRAQSSNWLLRKFESLLLGCFFVLRMLWGFFFERVNYLKLMRDGANVQYLWTHEIDAHSVNYEHIYDKDKFADIVSDSIHALNKCVECSFYDDKLLITIPHRMDLFEPNSLFEPALNAEDIKLVYELMRTIEDIVDIVVKAKDGQNKTARYN